MALTLIEQALAAQAAREEPPGPDELVQPYLERAIILGVYWAAEARHKGLGSDKEVEKNVRLARRAKIAEHEIDAAIAAGEKGI
jgi:hypothetical protein